MRMRETGPKPRKAAHHISPSPVVSSDSSTLEQLICDASRGDLTAACIVSSEGHTVVWQEVLDLLGRTRSALQTVGIAPTDGVALALPNGPALAAAFLAVASCTGCAPLGLSHSKDEYEFYLSDLKVKAIITAKNAAPAMEAVAAGLGIPLIDCQDVAGAPGLFTLDTTLVRGQPAYKASDAADVALYLYTSGTTSKPKLVPLRHSNLVAALGLSSSDRCLNVMPLFHIHGLVGGVLAPLAAGGSTVCPPRLQPG